MNHGDAFTLGADYERVSFPIVITRLKMAGVRLGHLLDDVIGTVHRT